MLVNYTSAESIVPSRRVSASFSAGLLQPDINRATGSQFHATGVSLSVSQSLFVCASEFVKAYCIYLLYISLFSCSSAARAWCWQLQGHGFDEHTYTMNCLNGRLVEKRVLKEIC